MPKSSVPIGDPISGLLEKVRLAVANSSISDHTRIHVGVKGTIVTLEGAVNCIDDKDIASAAAGSVHGVQAVVQKLKIEVTPEMREANKVRDLVKAALRANLEIPHDRIKVAVRASQILLDGTVRWNYQKDAVLLIVALQAPNLKVVDNITVDAHLKTELTKEKVLEIVKKDGRIACDDLSAIVNGRNLILVGSVPTADQKQLLQRIADEIPGIATVRNAVFVR